MKGKSTYRVGTLAVVAGLLALCLLPSAGAASPTPPSTAWIDDFDGPPLNSRWSWMNEDPTHWSLTDRPGFLRIVTQQQNNNYLVQNAPLGDYSIETHVFLEPTENFQQAGLGVYLDDENQLSLTRAYCGGGGCVGNGVYYDVIEGGGFSNYMLETAVQNEIWLRIVRQGNVYTAYASENGTDWSEVGAPAVGFTPNKIGLRAGNNGQPVGEIPADFDYFSLVDHTYRVSLPLVTRDYVSPKITLWHGWDSDEYEAVIADFNAAHPEMAVRVVYVPDMAAALAEAVPAGTGPDIAGFTNDPIGVWATAGYLAPVDPWVDLQYLQDNFEPAAVLSVLWDGHIWGIPELQEGIALVYNRDLIGEDQLPQPDDWAGFLAQADQFQQTHPGVYYLCSQGLGGVDAYHAAPVYFGHGMSQYGGYLDEDGNVYMNTPEALAAATWISDTSAYGPAQTSHQICRDMLVNGEAAIWWTGPWAIGDLHDAGVNYGIASMGSPFVSVRNVMLTPNAVDRGNADAALVVMQYLGSAEVQVRLALANRTIPANTAALHDPEVQALYEVAQFGASLNLGTAMGNHIYIPCQWGPVGDATIAIWNGSQTPEEAMAAAQTAIETCVAGISPP